MHCTPQDPSGNEVWQFAILCKPNGRYGDKPLLVVRPASEVRGYINLHVQPVYARPGRFRHTVSM